MTAPSVIQPAPRGAANAVAAVVVALVAGATVLGLFVAAITFAALAIAFPIAAPIASQLHVAVSPADLALAERLADLWWVFAALAVASLAAAVGVAVVAIRAIAPPPDDFASVTPA